MSGILGIFHLDNRPVDPADLTRMVDALAHRGPDGSGMWYDGPVGLGHLMLWTTPESLLEHLPRTSANGHYTITADARIDNRKELAAAINDPNLNAQAPDSAYILAAYLRWGLSCPEHLLGDFAFAIWDQQTQELFCARDHLGVKPFYYYQSDCVFAFASEIKGLSCIPEIPCEFNEVAFADWLTALTDKAGHTGDKAITFYKNIFRLMAGHSATVTHNEVRTRQYWSLDPTRELSWDSDDAYANEFRSLFTEAVRCRLRSAFPIGAELSGGLDSSSVACVARNVLKEGRGLLHTFSVIFPDGAEYDECLFINAVVGGGHVRHSEVHGSQLLQQGDIERILRHEDGPYLPANLPIDWAAYRAANHEGVRILLDGWGGDETVLHGVFYLNELFRRMRWIRLLREANKFARRRNIPLWSPLVEYAVLPSVPESLYRALLLLLRRKVPPNPSLISPDFAARTAQKRRTKAVSLQQSYVKGSTTRKIHYAALTDGTLMFRLEWCDMIAAAFSIELRHPFCDRRLVEFCLALPPDQRLSDGWTRMILRRALEGILPTEVQWRVGKARLSPRVGGALLDSEENFIKQVLFNDCEVVKQYFNVDAMRKMYERYATLRSYDDINLLVSASFDLLWLYKTILVKRCDI